MKDKIKLNKQGYDDYLKEIEKKERELADLRIYKGTDAIYQGDNWHDNPTLYQTELKEVSLMKEISNMKMRINNIEIIEASDNFDLIDIGDVIKATIFYAEDDMEDEFFRLVATSPKMNFEDEIKEVSVNSPIGNAIYQKKVGDTVNYEVDKNIFTIKILDKLNPDLVETTFQRKR